VIGAGTKPAGAWPLRVGHGLNAATGTTARRGVTQASSAVADRHTHTALYHSPRAPSASAHRDPGSEVQTVGEGPTAVIG
jgi:hypothetical protein